MNFQFLQNLSLTRKGLLIIIVPLIFQIAFFAFYLKLLDDTDQIVSTEYRAKNVIGRLNWISALVVAADFGATAYRFFDDKRFADTADLAEEKLARELSEASVLVSDDQSQAQLMAKIKNEVADLLRSLRQGSADRKVNQSGSLSVEDEKNFEKLQKLFELRHQMLLVETANHGFSISHLPQTRHSKRDFIALGIALDALVAVILFATFSRAITRRLEVLTNNIDKFSAGETLNAPVEGSDEVAVLDRNFHEMAGALRLAQQRKQEYLQMLSHDLRTPIANVLISIQLAERQLAETHESEPLFDAAERNLRTSLALINEILELETLESRAITLNYDMMTTTELFGKAIDSVRYLALDRSIEFEIDDPRLDFIGDLDRLVRVIINLLGNAIKFSPDKSKISIHARRLDTCVKITVSDQGRGIPANSIDAVFARFQQVEAGDQKMGSGLGLAVCKAIVEAHGGRIGVISEPGHGSTFWFEVPEEPN